MMHFRETLLVIPGIGGFPDFHQYLLGALSNRAERNVLTAAHGDSRGKPFETMGEHVAFWAKKVEDLLIREESKVSVLGLSFGAAIAEGLPPRVRNRLHRLVLVSPPFFPPILGLVVQANELGHPQLGK